MKFKNTLGQRETIALDKLVSDFEKNLEKNYPNLTIENRYKKYLNDIISVSSGNTEKFKFQSNETNSEFHRSGLWKETYERDSIYGLEINLTGKYMKAIYSIKDSDAFISRYYKKREATGMLPIDLFIKGVLNSKSDFNDYFHKRIVVIEFSF